MTKNNDIAQEPTWVAIDQRRQGRDDLGISNRPVIKALDTSLSVISRHSGNWLRSTTLPRLKTLPPLASPTASELFFDQVPHGVVLTHQLGVHALVL